MLNLENSFSLVAVYGLAQLRRRDCCCLNRMLKEIKFEEFEVKLTWLARNEIETNMCARFSEEIHHPAAR